MSGADVFKLADTITCHAWNKDRTRVAICPGTNEIWIYSNCNQTDVAKWQKDHVLVEHDLVVCALDWSPVTDKIVSCSHDRNAFVWTFNTAEARWEPNLVILRINRAALHVRWSPDGKKFAVASGAKVVPVCYYEDENNWWISKLIKRSRSTVLSVAWHPNSQLLAITGTDYKCRIISAYIDTLDATPDGGPFGEASAFNTQLVALDAPNGFWTENVAWSPCGLRLAYVSHGSTLTVVHMDSEGGEVVQQVLPLKTLPLVTVQFLTSNTILAAGHDRSVAVFTLGAHGDGSVGWGFDRFFETPAATDASPRPAAAPAAGGAASFRDRMRMFEARASQGVTSASSAGGAGSAGAGGAGSAGAAATAAMNTVHSNCITELRVLPGASASTPFISTSALDGQLVVWRLDKVPGLNAAKLLE